MVYKGFEVRPQVNNPKSLVIFHHAKAGKMPNALTGLFTSYEFAKSAIDAYVDNKSA